MSRVALFVTLCSKAQLLGSSLLTLYNWLAVAAAACGHVIERLPPLFTPWNLR
jgi:hypothetical protein